MFLRRQSLMELIRCHREETRDEHEETMLYLRQRHEEFMRREEKRDADLKSREEKRDEDLKSREEKRDEEFKQRDEEMREFNRELLLRNEKVYTNLIAQLEEMGRETRASTAQIRSNTEETKAQTKALLRVIDRLDGIDGAAAA